MYGHWQTICVRIEPANVARGVVKTHQAMNSCHFRECSIDGAMRIRSGQAARAYCHKRSQPRLSPLNGRVV